MQVEWYGQSAFALNASEERVFIDPFADMSAPKKLGVKFEYPPIEIDGVDLVLITHEHMDHNGIEAIGGEPMVLRSTVGRLESPIGEVLGISSEHDGAAGTERGPNTIFLFTLGSYRIVHFGDFGQTELRPEQRAAIGDVDLAFLPVGGGQTIGGAQAAAIAKELAPRWVVPMHYQTHRTGFLESEEEFLALMPVVERLDAPRFDTDELPTGAEPIAIVPAAP